MNWKILLLILVAVAGGLYQNWDKIWSGPSVPLDIGGHRVVMYATQTCGYCAKMRSFFAEKGIAYRELDVDYDKAADAAFRKLGGHGVPLTVVDGNKVIPGYQPDAVLRALQ